MDVVSSRRNHPTTSHKFSPPDIGLRRKRQVGLASAFYLSPASLWMGRLESTFAVAGSGTSGWWILFWENPPSAWGKRSRRRKRSRLLDD